MKSASDTVTDYFQMWNEPDADKRRELIESVWTRDAVSVDPLASVEGWDQIDAMIAQVQIGYPGHRFSLLSDIDTHHERLRFSWEMKAPDGTVTASGLDCVQLSDNGQFRDLTGFFDATPE